MIQTVSLVNIFCNIPIFLWEIRNTKKKTFANSCLLDIKKKTKIENFWFSKLNVSK